MKWRIKQICIGSPQQHRYAHILLGIGSHWLNILMQCEVKVAGDQTARPGTSSQCTTILAMATSLNCVLKQYKMTNMVKLDNYYLTNLLPDLIAASLFLKT